MKHILVMLALLFAACGGGTITGDTQPTGKGGGTFPIGFGRPNPLKFHSGYNGINYHEGAVLSNGVSVYFIWYGNWDGNTAPVILQDFITNLGGSPYFNINTTYFDKNHNFVKNEVHYAGSVIDNYSHGADLDDNDITDIVRTAFANGLPVDENAVYFVLTSTDVFEDTGFCWYYCGWHNFSTINDHNIKFSFVGNPEQCLDGCAAQSIGPNDNAGADGMASVIAHELEEATTDPNLDAWYDTHGAENADKCAWTFGITYTTANGAQANMNLGGRDYMIQRNWVNNDSIDGCALSY